MIDLETADSKALDEIASMYGLVRMPGENDSDLRERHKIFNNPNPWGYQPEKCECGAHKIGFTQKGPGHSDWCPLFSL